MSTRDCCKVLAVIPARGGSKRLKNKALKSLYNKPLIAWTINHALWSDAVDRVWVSTDCPEIMKIAKGYGAEVPFQRPAELAEGDVMAVESLFHALKYFLETEGYLPGVVVGLYPTFVFRDNDLIDRVVGVLEENPELDMSLAGIETVDYVWHIVGGEYRSLMEDAIHHFGHPVKPRFLQSLYGLANAYRPHVLLNNRLLGDNNYVVKTDNPYSYIEIDTLPELDMAEDCMKRTFANTPKEMQESEVRV